MINREKVISGLKYCLDRSKEKVHCGDCPYWQDDFESGCHIYDMIRDALGLLEAQKPVITTNAYGKKFYKCANCGFEFELYFVNPRRVKFCNNCGQGVKWE